MTAHTTSAGARGFGRELIEDALPYQFGAQTSYSFSPDGVYCKISVPLSTVV
jgi:two-component sensor histidine kinase